jgi:hypothetical protein
MRRQSKNGVQERFRNDNSFGKKVDEFILDIEEAVSSFKTN